MEDITELRYLELKRDEFSSCLGFLLYITEACRACSSAIRLGKWYCAQSSPSRGCCDGLRPLRPLEVGPHSYNGVLLSTRPPSTINNINVNEHEIIGIGRGMGAAVSRCFFCSGGSPTGQPVNAQKCKAVKHVASEEGLLGPVGIASTPEASSHATNQPTASLNAYKFGKVVSSGSARATLAVRSGLDASGLGQTLLCSNRAQALMQETGRAERYLGSMHSEVRGPPP